MKLDEDMNIMVKTLCNEHAIEKDRQGKLPDRGHRHTNTGRHVKNNERNDYSFFRDPPDDGPFKNKCLLLSLIMARSRQIFFEKRHGLLYLDRTQAKKSNREFSSVFIFFRSN